MNQVTCLSCLSRCRKRDEEMAAVRRLSVRVGSQPGPRLSSLSRRLASTSVAASEHRSELGDRWPPPRT